MNNQTHNTLRIGKIRFINLYPIYHKIENSCDCQSFEFVSGVPSKLNHLVRTGAIDLSPSSSIEYLRNPSLYSLIDGHSISSTGPVRSINLFSCVAIEELGGEEILTSSQSETSVVLLAVILRTFYALECSLIPTSETLTQALCTHKACLLIGDDALVEAQNEYRHLYVYDLGHLWQHFTGLPFVYALWIVNNKCLTKSKYPLFEVFKGYLDEAKKDCINHFSHIAREVCCHSPLSQEEVLRYWKGISYDFTKEHQKGLELFKHLAHEAGCLSVHPAHLTEVSSGR